MYHIKNETSMERQRHSFLARATMTLLLALFTAIGAWADVDPSTYVVINEKPIVTGGQVSNWATTENYQMLVDGKTSTKYGISDHQPYVEFNYATPITPKGYALWTANDTEGNRNPMNWTIKAKNESDTGWTTLVIVDNSSKDKLPMANDTETRFALNNTAAYQYFRFEAAIADDADGFQLAELQFLTTADDLAATVVSGIDKHYSHTVSAISITPIVTKQDNTTLTLGTHFTATLNGSTISSFPLSVTDIGTYTLVLTGTGDYTGTKTVTFSVLANEELTLSEDDELDASDDGHYYVNMRAVGPATLTLLDAAITTFKVYDDGGRANSYSNNCNGTLTITAPEGYAIQLFGSVQVESGKDSNLEAPRRRATVEDETVGNDYLTIYDGTTTSAPRLGKEKYGNESIQYVYSTGRSMTLHFQSDDANSMEGLNLTVKLVSTTAEYDITIPDNEFGTITASIGGEPVTKAKLNDKVTLTITPNDGYRLSRFNVDDQTNQWPVTVADDNTFLMPAGNITILASFLPAVSTTYIDERGVSQTVLATPIESSENYYEIKAPGFYTISNTKTFSGTIYIDAEENVSLILQDDVTLTCSTILANQCPLLTIYGQSKGNGKLIINKEGNASLAVKNYRQYGGDVSLNNTNSYAPALDVNNETLIAGGTLTATSTGDNATAIYSKDIIIRGGQVTATVNSNNDRIAINAWNSFTLGCSRSTDFIQINGRVEKHDGQTVSIAIGQTLTDETNNYTGVLTGEQIDNLKGKTLTPVVANITLANDDANADAESKNAAIITAKKGALANVTLTDRTLTKDGNWNTLCLPFAVTAEQLAETTHPLYGATIKELDATTSLENGVLTLKFNTATSIEAGKPYIVKWTGGESISNPVFSGVTIDNSDEAQARMTVTSTDGKVKFVGQYSPFSITADNINEILYIASGNRIGYSSKARELKCFCAHFWVQPNGMQQAASMISIDFGDSETTEIKTTNFTNDTNSDGAMYDLQGRQVTKPQKGLYIVNGRKVLVK